MCISPCWTVWVAWRHVLGLASMLTGSQEDREILPELGMSDQCVQLQPSRGNPSSGSRPAWAHLIVAVLLQEVAGHVTGQDVPEHVLIVFPQLLHLVDLLFGLNSPEEVQACCVLQLRFRGQKGKESFQAHTRGRRTRLLQNP